MHFVVKSYLSLMILLIVIHFGAIKVLSTSSSNQKDILAFQKSCQKSSSGISKSSLVIVSTLDGKLTAFDAKDDGKILWEIDGDGGPLLSSSLSSLKMNDLHGSGLHLIPSLNGILFKLEGDQVEAVPLNTETLLDSDHPLPDGSVLVGGRDATTCGINPDSGKMKYSCNAKGCKLTDESSVHISYDDVLVIRRNQRTVRAVDARTGLERWNYSVGLHDLSLALGADEITGRSKCPGKDKKLDWSVQISLMDRMVAVVRQDGPNPVTPMVMWTRTLNIPIAGAWILNGEYLQEVDLFAENVLPQQIDNPELRNAPSMYLGIHEGQTYVQTPREILTAINRASVTSVAVSQGRKNIDNKLRYRLSWKPYLATSSSRTPTLVTKELVVWNSHEYPYDNGYYMFGSIQPIIPVHKDRKNNKVISEETFRKWNSSKTCPDPKPKTILIGGEDRGSLLLWWKEVLALTVCSSFLAQYFLWRFFFSKRREIVDGTIQRTYSHVSVGTSSATVSTYISNDLQLPSSPIPATPSFVVDNFSSRFLSDFIYEQCLGKGGFGVVFQSKNILDECSYAVKRIRLLNCKEARDKVMREVKALAKLDHVGIVRYFNAWFEAPPPGWQEEQDKKLIEESSMTCHSMFTFSEVKSHTRSRKVSTKSDSSEKRKRTKSGSSARSRHSSYNSLSSEDPLGKRFNVITREEDMELLDIQGVHELYESDCEESHLEEVQGNGHLKKSLSNLDNSDSFDVEFVDERDTTNRLGSYHAFDDSESYGIEFKEDESAFTSRITNSCGLDNNYSCDFESSHRRVLKFDKSESFDVEFTEKGCVTPSKCESKYSESEFVHNYSKNCDSLKLDNKEVESNLMKSHENANGLHHDIEDSNSFEIEFSDNVENFSSHSNENDLDLSEVLFSDGPGGGTPKTQVHPSINTFTSRNVHNDESGSFSIEFADSSLDNETVQNKIDLEQFDYLQDDPECPGEPSEITGDSGNLTFDCSSSTSKPETCNSNNETSATKTGHSSQKTGVQSSNKSLSEAGTQTSLGGPLFLYIQMQLCRRDTLKTWLNINLIGRDHIYCLQIFDQIVSAVEYFHGQGMIHRDLKPSNIFFSLDGAVKVGDFGLVTELDTNGSRNDSNGNNGQRHTGPVGTQLYMSPEQVIGKHYNFKVDIYSLGLIFFELFQSFSTQMERITTLYSLRQQRFPKTFEQANPKHVQFVSWLMSEDPLNRPSAEEIKKSKLLQEIKQSEQSVLTDSIENKQHKLSHEEKNVDRNVPVEQDMLSQT